MGRPPCCDKSNVKRGLWTAEEDAKILAYVANHGIGNWTLVPKKAGLNRCGKSCRLRWTNYLRPDLNHNSFTPQEEELIVRLHRAIGSRWSLIAKQLPGRTDNDVKNYWNTKLRKKLAKMGIDPVTHKPISQILSDYGSISGLSNSRNRIGSLNRNLNDTLLSKSETSSVLTGTSSANMIRKPSAEQFQVDPFTRDPSGVLLAHFQVVNQQNVQPRFFNDVSPSSSSSSSSIVTQLSSSEPFSNDPSPVQITPYSPSGWSEFLLGDPFLSADSQRQEELELQRILSSTNSSILMQNETPQPKFPTTGNSNNLGGVGHEDFVASNYEITMKASEASSSSVSEFVAAILDRDSEMQMEFPEILMDESFQY